MADTPYASRPPIRQPRRTGIVAALLLSAAFLFIQLVTIDYGTRVNDLPHIRDYRIEKIDIDNSALSREAIAVSNTGGDETLDRWMMRYKLYSIEADEVLNVMALARINPGAGQFDPHFYQYGGAFLYPLGGWFYGLAQLGVLPLGSLETLLADPDRMDAIYVWGRILVLLAFTLSGFVLWLTLREVTRPSVAWAATGLYLFCPAAIMFSVVMKPHWYALLFVNGALFLVTILFARREWQGWEEYALALCLGFAVGSVTTLGLFAALVWFALLIAASRKLVGWVTLFRLPFVALFVYFASNPFVLLNWRALGVEGENIGGWFVPSLAPADLLLFIENSFLSGLGVAFGVLLVFIVLREMITPSFVNARPLALAIGAVLILAAAITAAHAQWHTNLRYVPYVIPAGLMLIAASWELRAFALFAAFALTLVQTVPTKLVYFDENDPDHSTRFLAAAWIDANLPAGSGICLPTLTPTPYDVPPFDLSRYAINDPACPYRVVTEREGDMSVQPEGYAVLQRFRPRLTPEWLPSFSNHVNPQITIYQRT